MLVTYIFNKCFFKSFIEIMQHSSSSSLRSVTGSFDCFNFVVSLTGLTFSVQTEQNNNIATEEKHQYMKRKKIFKSKKIHKTTSQLYMDGRDGIYKKNNILFDLIWMYNLISVVFIFLLEKKNFYFFKFFVCQKRKFKSDKIYFVYIYRKENWKTCKFVKLSFYYELFNLFL